MTNIGASNGLLRQYFPKGTDLRAHDPERLAAVAAELNARPRKSLGWNTPAERLTRLSSPTARSDQRRTQAAGCHVGVG